MSRVLVLTTVIWCLLGSAVAQNVDTDRLRVNINAKLMNDYGQPVEGVVVTLIAQDLTRKYEAVVNADGTLRFENVQPGEYLVQMQLSDFVFLRADEKGRPFVVTVNNDGTLAPDNFRIIRQPVVRRGMWREILIFLGIAASGAAAVS